MDLFATIIEMAGGNVAGLVPPGTPIDSVSLLPLLKYPLQNDLCQYVFAERFSEPPRNSDGKTIRNDQYKLIRFDLGGEGFYRMSNDPLQYPADEASNLLNRTLNVTEQANYDALSIKLDSLLIGNDTDRLCIVDADGDGIPNSQDSCPFDPLNDSDGDGLCANVDNCPTVANLNQIDTDGDLIGDACDTDDDGDGLLDIIETNTGVFVSPGDTGTDPLVADTDGDGVVWN